MPISKRTLKGFTGTENYHKFNPITDLVATDGIIYLFQKANCFWLGDIVASTQQLKDIKENNAFIVWRIAETSTGATVSAYSDSDSEGNYPLNNRLYHQELSYTDFPFDLLGEEFEFYQINGVLLLKSEY